jgi:anti-sigma B factor antagonist
VKDLDERRAPTVDARGIRPPPAYAIEAGPLAGSVAVLVLRGELDMAAAPALRARLQHPGAVLGVVVDLAEVTFVDSAVLKELLRARAELGGRGVRLMLAGVPQPVQRLLDLTRTAELFDAAPDVDRAVERLAA